MVRSAGSIARVLANGALLLALGLTLSACGRKGPLDLPPASSTAVPQSDLQTDADGKAVAPPGLKRRILIDKILD